MPRSAVALLAVACALGLLAACAPEDRPAQREALARWEDRRLAPTDSLATMIAGPDAAIRRAALRTAGLIGRTDVVPAMIDALDDRSQAVRCQAAFSLGLLGGDVAVAPLTAALADPHLAVRVAACQGLAHQEHDGAMLYEPALRGEVREAEAAWTALRNVAGRADHDSLVAAIRTGLSHPENAVRWRVLRCAERVADPTLVDQIAPFAADRDVQVRVHALRALARQEGTAALEAVLRSGDRRGRLSDLDRRRVQVAELRALGRLAGPVLAADREGEHTSLSGRTAALMMRGAESTDPPVAETALVAMAAATADLDLPAEAAGQESLLPVWRIRMVRVARQRLADPAPAIRAAASGALGSLRREGARPELEAMLADPDPTVAAAALQALVALAPDATALAAYRDLARDRGPRVFEALQSALSAAWTDSTLAARPAYACEAYRTATLGLADGDFTVRTSAATLLGRFPGGLACNALLEAYVRAGADLAEGAADVRLAILPSLQEIWTADNDGHAPFAPTCVDSAAAATCEDAAATADPLACRELCPTHREATAALLRGAFDHPDLRIRLAARRCAEGADLLPEALIPSAASLRETLPPAVRDPRQPAVRLPFAGPEIRCVTDRGTFTIRLDAETAPNTCANVLRLIADGFYEDNVFHRVVPDFVIQGGCPRGDGWGGPGWTIRSEWSRRPFDRGTVGIAHSGKDTGGSQWFVCHSPQPHLDGRYTVFGEVVSGMDVVDRIERGDRYRLEVVGE